MSFFTSFRMTLHDDYAVRIILPDFAGNATMHLLRFSKFFQSLPINLRGLCVVVSR